METRNETTLRLFRSANLDVRVRAATLLLAHDDTPLGILLEILDELSDQGLGAATERVLRRRNDPELVGEMIRRLRSPESFVREVACDVLGRRGGPEVTRHLIAALYDPHMMVRRSAGFALAERRDPAAAAPLLQRYRESAHDDFNVRLALECALNALGVRFD